MRAPKYQPNQVGAATTTRARFQSADNGGGVAGAVGQGLQQLGQAGSQFAEVQDRINARNDDTQARKIAAEAGVQFDTLTAEFGALSAGEARSRQEEYSTRANEIRDTALGGAENERMRRLAEERIISPHGQSVSRIAGHALREARVERVATFEAQSQSLVQQAIGAESPGLRDQRVQEAVEVRFEMLEEEGFNREDNPEIFATEGRKVSDQVHDSVLDRMLAVAEPSIDDMFAYITAYGDEMLEETVSTHLARIQQPLQKRSARSGADMVMGLLQAGDVEQVEQEFSYATPVEGRIPQGGRFHDHRDGGARSHRALDISAATGTPIFTIAPGEVTKVVPLDGASGNWVEVTHPDGTSSTYAHMEGFDVEVGAVVAAGDQIGRVGNTGVGTGPHLHLVVRDAQGNRVDPEGILGSSSSGHVAAPRDWDRAEIERNLSQMAERQGWSPEQTERVRAELDQRVSRDEGLLREQQGDADQAAAEIVLERGEGLTSTNMIPAEIWANMSVAARTSIESVVDRNNTPAAPTANSPTSISLNLMRFYEPERFENEDFSRYVGELTMGEIESLMTQQAKMRTGDDEGGQAWSPRSGIVTAFNFEKRFSPDLNLEDEDEAAILRIMESEARAMHAASGGRDLTEDDYRGLFRSATREITTNTTFAGIPTGQSSRRRFELNESNIPDASREQIVEQFKTSMGREPTDEEVVRIFRVQAR